MSFTKNQRVELINNVVIPHIPVGSKGYISEVGEQDTFKNGLYRVKFDGGYAVNWLKETRLAAVEVPLTHGDIVVEALARFQAAANAMGATTSQRERGVWEGLRFMVPAILTTTNSEAVLRALVGAK